MTGDEIREAFLSFYESKGHLRIPSSSLIPAGDSTLLLTNAGMVQFKPYFTGEMTPPQRRLTSVQKCLRTTDIDSVGDATHLTFFEMLGNFSVGDYFKKDAIEYAWEFVTAHLGLENERLWATVYLDDDESLGYWTTTGIPVERIRRFGEEDNFWGPAGNEGPCGPCSEIHYDFGEGLGCLQPDCGPNCENVSSSEVGGSGLKCDRFVELWNLVFMQYYQAPDGSRAPLPAPNIDTGMGLERAAVILQGKRSIYDTDFFQPIVQKVAELCGKRYGDDPDTDYAIRVVAEHARSAAFLISDGVVPGNEGRAYVLRRVIRRAIRYGKKLGLEAAEISSAHVAGAIHELPLPVEGRAVLPLVAEVVIDVMKGQHPDLEERREFILRVIGLEEERFGGVLNTGLELLEEEIRFRTQEEAPLVAQLKKDVANLPAQSAAVMVDSYKGKLAQQVSMGGAKGTVAIARMNASIHIGLRWDNVITELRKISRPQQFPRGKIDTLLAPLELSVRLISGRETFELYDTYGFPLELTQEIAREHGLDVHMEGFELEMEVQRERARAAAGKFGGDFDAIRVYQDLGVGSTTFLGYETLTASSVIVGLLVDDEPVSQAAEGKKVEVVLRETPFYAEMGGQMGDAGEITAQGCALRVEDTQAPVAGLTVHRCVVVSGGIAVGDTVDASVDTQRRQDTARNHTATHMLHAALRQVLGSHVRQHGSLVTLDRLRFDFTHVSALSPEELSEVQRLTNEKVRENISVTSRETTYRQAVSRGALAFFGDKYGDQVRVVEVANGAPFSMEVCGGTHVHSTGDIGLCHIVSESGIGSGLRRIEAVTGRGAEALLSRHSTTLEDVARRLQVPSEELAHRVEGLITELEQVQRRAESLERELLKRQVAELPRKQVADVNVVSGELSVSAVELLREAGDWLKNDLKSGIVVLGTTLEGRPTMVIMATKDLVDQGFHAGNVVKKAADAMDGGGGGRPDMARAGGPDPAKLKDALRAAEEEVKRWREKH